MQKCCPLCEIIDRAISQQEPSLILEFEDFCWLLGNNQYYRGYTVLVAKTHICEWHQFPLNANLRMQKEMMRIAEFIYSVFQPNKLNYASFGNVVAHHHVHIVPRYLHDPNVKNPPDLNASNFPNDCWQAERLQAEAKRLGRKYLRMQNQD